MQYIYNGAVQTIYKSLYLSNVFLLLNKWKLAEDLHSSSFSAVPSHICD